LTYIHPHTYTYEYLHIYLHNQTGLHELAIPLILILEHLRAIDASLSDDFAVDSNVHDTLWMGGGGDERGGGGGGGGEVGYNGQFVHEAHLALVRGISNL